MSDPNLRKRCEYCPPQRNIAFFGGGILAVVCVICGVVMLLMKWAGAHPPALMSQIPLILLPVAFLALMVSIVLAVLRRRAS